MTERPLHAHAEGLLRELAPRALGAFRIAERKFVLNSNEAQRVKRLE